MAHGIHKKKYGLESFSIPWLLIFSNYVWEDLDLVMQEQEIYIKTFSRD